MLPPQIARLKIAEINRIEGLHEELAGLPGFQASDYDPGARPGEIVAGIRLEDLSDLTYPDDSFISALMLGYFSTSHLERIPLRRRSRGSWFLVGRAPATPTVPRVAAQPRCLRGL